MTVSENLDLLAQQDWEGQMKDVFKEAEQRFKVLKKSISDHDKVVEKARKVAAQAAKKAEHEKKKVATMADVAARACGCIRGKIGGGRGRGRGERGRGAASNANVK